MLILGIVVLVMVWAALTEKAEIFGTVSYTHLTLPTSDLV